MEHDGRYMVFYDDEDSTNDEKSTHNINACEMLGLVYSEEPAWKSKKKKKGKKGKTLVKSLNKGKKYRKKSKKLWAKKSKMAFRHRLIESNMKNSWDLIKMYAEAKFRQTAVPRGDIK
jgi:hypothetical protein